MVKHLDDSTFASEIESGVTLVDFAAEWCGPCKMLAPILEDLEKDVGDKATICKVDVDASQATAASFGITSVPTLILFKDGKEIEKISGLRDKEALLAVVNSAL